MLLSEIGDKEIIDISKGSMHGRLWDAEMLFDEATGVIHSLSVPEGIKLHHLKTPVNLFLFSFFISYFLCAEVS